MKRYLAILLILLPAICFAAENFPALTGRVVDNAHILSATTIQNLSAKLEAHEKQTTNQIVIVTIPSLNNQPIEDFGYKLGRKWGIGQKGKNNGVLFIIAPNDRQTRIEVGYGLEGKLTDALSSQIIQTIVLPRFREGNFDAGVTNGTEAIISILGGNKINFPEVAQQQAQQSTPDWAIIIFILIIILIRIYGGFWIGVSGFSMGRGGFSSGGGFSGGGGSFGGGGSSGRW